MQGGRTWKLDFIRAGGERRGLRCQGAGEGRRGRPARGAGANGGGTAGISHDSTHAGQNSQTGRGRTCTLSVGRKSRRRLRREKPGTRSKFSRPFFIFLSELARAESSPPHCNASLNLNAALLLGHVARQGCIPAQGNRLPALALRGPFSTGQTDPLLDRRLPLGPSASSSST